jgi:hypothetical protein
MRKAAMTASDTVTANPFAKPFMPASGKMMRPVASMASPATTATKWKRVEGIFSPSYVTRRLVIPRAWDQVETMLNFSGWSAVGQKAKYPLRADVFRFGPESGLKTDIAGCPFRASVPLMAQSGEGASTAELLARATPLHRLQLRCKGGFPRA